MVVGFMVRNARDSVSRQSYLANHLSRSGLRNDNLEDCAVHQRYCPREPFELDSANAIPNTVLPVGASASV